MAALICSGNTFPVFPTGVYGFLYPAVVTITSLAVCTKERFRPKLRTLLVSQAYSTENIPNGFHLSVV